MDLETNHFNCGHCRQIFPSLEELKVHLKDSHPQVEEKLEIYCQQCDKTFPTLDYL